MAVPGTMGKIAAVNLSSGTVEVETPPDELYRNYLGGYGLGGYYLYTRTRAGIDPMGPENLLGFFSGPLTGTPAICGHPHRGRGGRAGLPPARRRQGGAEECRGAVGQEGR